MTLAAFAFALGAALVQLQAEVPALAWGWLLIPLAGLAAWQRRLLFLPALALGFFWAALLAQQRMADVLAPALEGRDVQLVGVVSSLPAVTERGARFELDVESAGSALPSKLLLSWYRTPLAEEAADAMSGVVHP